MNWFRDLKNPKLEKKVFSNSLVNIYSVHRKSLSKEKQTDLQSRALITIRFLLEIPQFFSKKKQYPLFLSKEIKSKKNEIFYFPLALAVEKKSLHFLFEFHLYSPNNSLKDFLFSTVERQENLKKASIDNSTSANQILTKNIDNKNTLLKIIIPSSTQVIYLPLNIEGALFHWTNIQHIKTFHDLRYPLQSPHWSFPFFIQLVSILQLRNLASCFIPINQFTPLVYPWQLNFVIYQNKNHLFILAILNDIFNFKKSNQQKLNFQKKIDFNEKEINKKSIPIDKSRLHFCFYLSIIQYLSYCSKTKSLITTEFVFLLQKIIDALFLSLNSYLQVSYQEKLIKKMNELFQMLCNPYLSVCYNIPYKNPISLLEYQKLSLVQKIKCQLLYLKWNETKTLIKKEQLKDTSENFIKLINKLIDERTRQKKKNHLFFPFSCQLFWQKRKLGQLLKSKIFFLPTADELLELQSLANKLFKTKGRL